MRTLLTLILFLTLASRAHADVFGTDGIYTCTSRNDTDSRLYFGPTYGFGSVLCNDITQSFAGVLLKDSGDVMCLVSGHANGSCIIIDITCPTRIPMTHNEQCGSCGNPDGSCHQTVL